MVRCVCAKHDFEKHAKLFDGQAKRDHRPQRKTKLRKNRRREPGESSLLLDSVFELLLTAPNQTGNP